MCSYADQLKPYQNFEDENQLKKAFNLFRKVFRHELNDSDNKVLFKMTGYAAKFPGACKLRLEKIAKITSLSVATVKRVIAKAVKLGIIKRFKTRKENGRRQGATVYQFQHFTSELQGEPQTMSHRQYNEKPCESNVEETKNEAEALSSLNPSLSFKDTIITKKPSENNLVDKELFKKNALLDKIPTALKGLSVYFDNAQDIYNIVGIIFRSKNKVSKNIKIEEHEGLFRRTVASVYEYWKRQVKAGKEDYNVFGLMNKAVKELCERIVDGTAYKAHENVSKAPKRKFENIPAWMKDKVLAFGNVRTEKVPDWFENRNEEVKTTNENIDFEAERQKVLAKLRGQSNCNHY